MDKSSKVAVVYYAGTGVVALACAGILAKAAVVAVAAKAAAPAIAYGLSSVVCLRSAAKRTVIASVLVLLNSPEGESHASITA